MEKSHAPGVTTPGVTTTRWTAAVIIVSDRILSGAKDNAAGRTARELLERADCTVSFDTVVAEEEGDIEAAVLAALGDAAAHPDLILLAGGTGVRPGNVTPEVTERYIELRLPGLETQVLLAGLANSPKAGLSRGIIGMHTRSGPLIINSASSPGAVRDTLGVVLPLLSDLLRECGGHRH